MTIKFDNIDWTTYVVPDIGEPAVAARWRYHQFHLPATKADDGYWYVGMVRPATSSEQEGDDPDYDYVDLNVTYEFDWDGKYSAYNGYYHDSKRYQKLKQESQDKGLPETRHYRAKGVPRPRPATNMRAAAAATPGINDHRIRGGNISGNSIKGEAFLTDAQIESIGWSLSSIIQGMLEAGGDVADLKGHNNDIMKAMKDVEAAMLKEADSFKNKEMLKALGKQLDDMVGDTGKGTRAIGAAELEKAQAKALETAEKEFAERMASEKLKAGEAAAAKSIASSRLGNILRSVGKVFEVVNNGKMIYDASLAISDGMNGDVTGADRLLGVLVDLGVSVATGAAAVAAGAMAGSSYGALTGSVVGLCVGLALGAVWGVANFVCLTMTDKSLSELIGHKLMNFAAGRIAPVAQPAASNYMRGMTTASPEGSWWDVITSMGGGF